jgi:membrane peptidoglycan carboxypeptidase
VVAQLAGSIELAPGSYRFKNGRELHYLPKIEVQFRVPKVACSKLLASIPAPIVPQLQGFGLQGSFEADLHTKIDLSDLDALELGGKVGIDGCQVVKARAEVKALSSGESLAQTVEVPPEPTGIGNNGTTMTFIVGADNPDFVPFSGISPHLINAIMTTEDSGFFKHRGWVTPVFKTALRRNIENGGFRLGASSITMQMVKNLLLSQEKTLSRKLQELFLVWYLEQILPKERILELYFNAIEFGPRLYGIGPAARHYFGKEAADITPLEAAFFSSILPSPKRRYVHYCHGALSPAWEKYLRRILTRMHERDRLTDEEYATAAASTLTFDRGEMTLTEKQCLDWVRRITAKPEVEVESDAEAQ